MSDKNHAGPDSFEDSQTLHLDDLFTGNVTETGSFDMKGGHQDLHGWQAVAGIAGAGNVDQ